MTAMRTTPEPWRDSSSFVYLSGLLGRRLRSGDGAHRGRITDFIATMTEKFPELAAVILGTSSGQVMLRLTPQVASAVLEGVPVEDWTEMPPDVQPPAFLLRRSLLDRQVVDVKGAKVVRVNDLHLLCHSGRIYLVHVDIGFTGLARRLGVEGGMKKLAGILGRKTRDELITWKFIQPLTTSAGTPHVQLSLRQEQLRQMHPAELADIIEELDPGERLALVRSMDTAQLADIMEEAEENIQAAVLGSLETGLAADILEEMEPAAAVDAVEMLSEETQQKVMAAMESEEREQIEILSQAEEDTAASLMTPEYVSCRTSATVGDAMAAVRESLDQVQFISYVYCLDPEGRLLGTISLRQLLRSDPKDQILEVMNRRLAVIHPGDDFESVADEFFKFRLHALPVVDHEGRLMGVVTFEHSFDELLQHYRKLAG
jgi:CBS domain-containing protein